MGRYNAISFDLWMTLIRSNSRFKAARDEMVFQKFNPKHKSLAEVSKIIRSVDVRCNSVAEHSGNHVSSRTMWALIFNSLKQPIEIDTLKQVDNETQSLFKMFPPVNYDQDTLPTLQKLVKKNNLYVVSNTGFIRGDTILKTIDPEIIMLISDWNFSDEKCVAKPNRGLFFPKVDIHVGDNPIADGGCEKLGISFFHINTNRRSIKDLL
jgi:putative hydrolase of the HAD superfamily